MQKIPIFDVEILCGGGLLLFSVQNMGVKTKFTKEEQRQKDR